MRNASPALELALATLKSCTMSGAGGECEIRGDEQHQNGVAREGVGVGGVRGLIIGKADAGRTGVCEEVIWLVEGGRGRTTCTMRQAIPRKSVSAVELPCWSETAARTELERDGLKGKMKWSACSLGRLGGK